MVSISIVTINYNNAYGLKSTLKSIQEQGIDGLEVIVIDGGSNDGSQEIMREFDFLISEAVSEPDNGIYHAMNKGISLCNNEFVHLLNSGDVYYNSSSLKNVQIPDDKDFHCSCVLKLGKRTRTWQPMKNEAEEFVDVAHPGLIVRRNVYAKSLYNETFAIVSDSLFIFENVKPQLSLISSDTLVVMEQDGISSKTSIQLEIEKFKMLWFMGYRKNVRLTLQMKYILVYFLKLLGIK